MVDAKKIEELLPCPFCGGAAQAEHFESKLGRWRWSIGCNDHTSKADDGGEPAAECYGFQSMTSFATKAEAIAAWNRRATASEARAEAAETHSAALARALEELVTKVDAFWNDPERPSVHRMRSKSVHELSDAQRRAQSLLAPKEDTDAE